MLAVSRFTVPEAAAADFVDSARAVLSAYAAQPGHRRGRLARAADDPAEWLLISEWDGVGAYRRALSAYDVRVVAMPLFARVRDEPNAYEVLHTVDGEGRDITGSSDRAGGDPRNGL